ncbi:rho guanine nucleotide exchange factor 17 isoform X1 [Centruroides vittatus]|uniref:rho guanine nucleotide exchange factor 17 isoform X1 n=1 Tax=Centruroides vittatus TaxID=120091 RepID=UPI00350F424A
MNKPTVTGKETQTTSQKKPDAVLTTSGSLFEEWRDEGVPKIAKYPKLSYRHLTTQNGADASQVVSTFVLGDVSDTGRKTCSNPQECNITLDDIIKQVEELRNGLDHHLVSQQMEKGKLNNKPAKLNLNPSFQLTKLTKVSSPGPSSLPCSPVPNRSPVRLRPDIPSYLTLCRKGKDTLGDESTKGEDPELLKIRDILSGLDLNKYKRRKAPEGCDTKCDKPAPFCRSISNVYPLNNSENVDRVCNKRLRELTELLKPSTIKIAEEKSKVNNGNDSLSEDVQSDTKSGMLIINTCTLPKKKVLPLTLPTLPPKTHNSETLKALSLATPLKEPNKETVQNKIEVRTFPRATSKISKTTLFQNRINEEVCETQKEKDTTKRQVAIKPLNFSFPSKIGDASKTLPNKDRSVEPFHNKVTSHKSDPDLIDNREKSSKSSELSLPSNSSTLPSNFKQKATFNEEVNPQQKRYYKKKLRGPYGEMLEEEMRKYEGKPKHNYNQEFQMLMDFCGKKTATETQLSLYCSSNSLGDPRFNHEKIKSSTSAPIEDKNNDLLLLSEMVTTTSEPNLTHHNSSFVYVEEAKRKISDEDTRTHVVRELHCTEESYVESLEILVNKYMKPLKCAEYLDSTLVDEVFYQVPGILEHHRKFLNDLEERVEKWDCKQTIGDIFIQTFSQNEVIDTYTSFINNWKSAKGRIKAEIHKKPSFSRFLEHMSREHKGKLTLDALLIMPVQRIPRYELLIKELLKHTSIDHSDHQLLALAQKEVHDLAVKINQVEQETVQNEQMIQRLREIENLIDGAIDIVQSNRIFISYDLVSIPVGFGIKKDRGLFLFSDLLLITSIKRKSGTVRKSSPVNNPLPFGLLETNKYKLLMKFSIDQLDVSKNIAIDGLEKKVMADVDHLEDDLAILGQISDLVSNLKSNHQILDEAVRDLQNSVSKHLVERQTGDVQLLTIELNVTTHEGIEKITLIFPTCEKRITWENAFVETKQKYESLANRNHPPEFVCSIPVRKTRAGLQFTCATPTLSLNQYGYQDIWVCNSDGYVGQVCILSLQPEPTVTSCNGICNSRILCAISVPAYENMQIPNVNSKMTTNKNNNNHNFKRDSWRRMNGNIQLESDSSEDDDEKTDIGDASTDETENVETVSNQEYYKEKENEQPTMWLGTEDGCILVYSCNENIRIKKNKTKIQHSSPIFCLVYFDNQIFVSLANGELAIYTRKDSGIWNFDQTQKIQIGNGSSSVTYMLGVNGKLWCGCQNFIKVLNTDTHKVEYSIQVGQDSTKSVISMVLSGLGVWIALKCSPVIFLYHVTTYEYLTDISVVPAVSKMLACCDDIIQQHKSACLRITSLLACKDLLWIGTSAGVVLTMPLSNVTSVFNCLDNINISGISQGHTGHVRFLTCVDMEQFRDTHRLSYSDNPDEIIKNNKLLVISGGDGYEDFQSGFSEALGHDDSTNHLLLWHV